MLEKLTVHILRSCMIDGKSVEVGKKAELPKKVAQDLVNMGKAEIIGDEVVESQEEPADPKSEDTEEEKPDTKKAGLKTALTGTKPTGNGKKAEKMGGG